MNDVTRIINAIERGGPCATEELLPLVYNELRRLEPASCRKSRSNGLGDRLNIA